MRPSCEHELPAPGPQPDLEPDPELPGPWPLAASGFSCCAPSPAASIGLLLILLLVSAGAVSLALRRPAGAGAPGRALAAPLLQRGSSPGPPGPAPATPLPGPGLGPGPWPQSPVAPARPGGCRMPGNFTWVRAPEPPHTWRIEGLCDSPAHYQRLLRRCLRGARVLFAGDSLTRYGYLNLANFAATGSWRPSFAPPSEVETGFRSWNAFYYETNARLGGREICDCYRDKHFRPVLAGAPDLHSVENRYARFIESDPHGLNLTLTYLQTFGSNPLAWHDPRWMNATCRGAGLAAGPNESDPSPPDVDGSCAQAGCAPGACSSLAHLRAAPTLEGLEAMAALLRPTVLVLNSGHWDAWARPENVSALNVSLNRIARARTPAPRLVWKTTTATWHARPLVDPQQAALVDLFRGQPGREVFDAAEITRPLHARSGAPELQAGDVFWDQAVHFQPSVYTELNKLLLLQLAGSCGEELELEGPQGGR